VQEEVKMFRADRVGYQQLSGFSANIFTDDELAEIHQAAIYVLQNTGLLVLHEEARDIFYSHGCTVDKRTNIVKIPPYIIEDAIKSAPSEVLLAARDSRHDYLMGGKRVGFTNFGVAVQVLDMDTGKIRQSTYKDSREAAILCDALDGIDVLLVPMTSRDKPVQVQPLYTTEAALNNCTKHFIHVEVLSTDDVRRFVEMSEVVAGSAEELRRRPIVSVGVAVISPLQFYRDTCEVIIETSRQGLPIHVGVEVMAGASAPVSLAGALVQHLAEWLGGLILSQLTKKGAPVILFSSSQMFDLRACNACVGDPEYAMINAACARLADFYNLPCVVGGT
jgi:trimethylamine--corrinoid protein Co-methyltransferase